MLLSTVIVGYWSRAPLLECLRSLGEQANDFAAETVVVDNASGDGTLDAVAESHPAVRRIANSENVGYARAVNQGIAATTGEYVLVMNPDCELRPGALVALIDHLSRNPGVAIAGPRILNPDGSLEYSARSFPDHLTFLFNRYSLLTRWFPNNPYSRRYLLTDWDHASVRGVDWLSGACLMVRREAIARVGPMDEQFFMFNEDVDWCRRMKLAGWGVVYVPGAVVVHHVGASRSRVASKVIFERHRGMIHYFHKHHPTNPVMQALADGAILLRAGLMMTANALRPR
ncbi:MAG TPA: glycosyltransferase family 2 protein [Candidatus Limnocylindria bacterium]|nr:glycosyltransferase family 2 protein [Candidatus Limnocylindria bacterium]